MAASSGAQALRIMREVERDGQSFQLILVDFQMPGMDGLELVRRMLSQASPATPPIMMLSSVGWQVSSDQCEELGISVYLTKPVTTSTLFDAIIKVLSANSAVAPPRQLTAAPATDPHGGKRLENSGGGRRLYESDSGHQYSEAEWLCQRDRQRRPGSCGNVLARSLRSDPDGCADAQHEWPGSNQGDSEIRRNIRTAHADPGFDGARHGRRPGAMHRGRHGRLPVEADPCERSFVEDPH